MHLPKVVSNLFKKKNNNNKKTKKTKKKNNKKQKTNAFVIKIMQNFKV